MKTYSAKAGDIQRMWYVIDGDGMPIGRLAVQAAVLLRGKHKPTFTPNVDTGDFVIVVNAARVALTGNKASERVYRHSGWPGGIKSISRGEELARKPEEAVRRVIRGMLPHTRLGDAMYRKLKVYAGPDHPHEAQQPVAWAGLAVEGGE